MQVAADNNLGAATGPLSFNGGTLATTASFTSGRATTINSGGGTFDVAPSTTLTMSGAIGGAGALSKSNAGTLVLAADNTYAGGTTISRRDAATRHRAAPRAASLATSPTTARWPLTAATR